MNYLSHKVAKKNKKNICEICALVGNKHKKTIKFYFYSVCTLYLLTRWFRGYCIISFLIFCNLTKTSFRCRISVFVYCLLKIIFQYSLFQILKAVVLHLFSTLFCTCYFINLKLIGYLYSFPSLAFIVAIIINTRFAMPTRGIKNTPIIINIINQAAIKNISIVS